MKIRNRHWVVVGALAALGSLSVQGCGSGDSSKVVNTPRGGGAGEAGAAGDQNGEAGQGTAGDAGSAGQAEGGSAGQAGGESDAGSAGEAGMGGGGPGAAGHLWVLDRTSLHLYGYAASALQTTNGDPAAIDIALTGMPTLNNSHLVFDPKGDLWISELNAYRISAADLTASGTAQPVAMLANIGGNYGKIAFDPAGNLWRQIYTNPPLTRFDAADVATLTTTNTTLVPKFTSTAASDYPLVFDAAGNLYTGFYATQGATGGPNFFGRYDASQLVGTGASIEPPALSLLPRYDATALARTPTGDFVLVNGSNKITRYSAAQMAGTGINQELTPDAVITLDVTGNPPAVIRVAVDAEGNLFLADGTSRLLKLAAADLEPTGSYSVKPAMTLRARAEDANAAFQAITVH